MHPPEPARRPPALRSRGPALWDDAAVADESIAVPHACTRCAKQVLLGVVGRCADCIADMGLRHPDEYQVWKSDVGQKYGRK